MRRLMWGMTLMLVSAMPALAQIDRMPRVGYGAQPDYWVGLSYGYLGGTTIGSPMAAWQFGYTSQIRATIEKSIQRGFSAGVSAGFANAPLTYENERPTLPPPGDPCPASCDANANVTQLLAFVSGGGSGIGFHGLYNLEAGFTEFSNFREATTNQSLESSPTYDFTFGLGGGLGYYVSPVADVYVGEQYDFILDQQPVQVGRNSSAPRQFTFRVGFRYGF